jgi:filamin
MQVVNNRDGTWTVHYTPQEVGETYLDVFLADELVPGCPFKVNIFDVHQIHVSNVQGGLVNQLVKFEIDASQAGVGQLEIVIQDGRIPCDALPRGAFHFDASFLAPEPGAHTIDIRFNGLPVPGNATYAIELHRVCCF